MTKKETERCGWWNHDEARALRGALVEIFESWKDLNRICEETAFPDSDGLFESTIKAADVAQKRVLRILKKTDIKV